MSKIITVDQAIPISQQLRADSKKLVLAGGCFDILHIGHIRFLEKAKSEGDILMLLLESDKKIKERKGPNRPINSQSDRAAILSALTVVDYVVLLPYMPGDDAYKDLVFHIKPAIIPMTENDPYYKQKGAFATQTGGKAMVVIPAIRDSSTSRIVTLLENENI